MPETVDSPKQPSQVTLARWSDRFFAWLIDYIIIFAGGFAVFFVAIYASNFKILSTMILLMKEPLNGHQYL